MALLAGCTTWDSFKYTFLDDHAGVGGNIIRIGVFEPTTGRYSDAGNAEVKGIELANSIYSSVNGYRVELVKVDTQSSTAVAETAIQSLIEMGPVAIIGSSGEATSLIASRYITEAKIPTITPSATNPLITQNSGYYFRACITESQMGAGAAEYAFSNLKSRHIGLATGKNDTSARALIDGFDDRISSLIKKENKKAQTDEDKIKKKDVVVMQDEIVFDEDGMNKLVSDMRKNNVDVLYISQGTETMDDFFTLAEKKNLTNVTFIGNSSWSAPEFIEMMGRHPNIQVIFPYEAALDDRNNNMTEEADRFRILYQNRYGTDDEPSSYAAHGYDSYLLLINAISNANSLEGADIRDAMLELSGVEGSTGKFEFDRSGNTIRTVDFYTIRGGELEYRYTTQTATESMDIEDIGSQEDQQIDNKKKKKKKTVNRLSEEEAEKVYIPKVE